MSVVEQVDEILLVLDNQVQWKARGQRYRSLRERENLDRLQVADALGMTDRRLKYFEHGWIIEDDVLLEEAYNQFLFNV